MHSIAIVYFSGSGHTAQMAEAVRRGAAAIAGATVSLVPIEGQDIVEGRFRKEAVLEQLTNADALVFGTPTYMGGPAGQFKAFADATAGLWYQQKWAGKLAAGFTHSGMSGGDKLATLNYLALFAAQHGMLWVGNAELPSVMLGKTGDVNRTGSYMGAMGFGSDKEVHAGDLATAEALGRRVAALAQRVAQTATPAAVAA